MDRFGAIWVEHPAKIEKNWLEMVAPDDVVLVPGDISWGKKLGEAMPDLLWLSRLPGEKVILKGNHDYWWPNSTTLHRELPPTVQAIHNDHIRIGPFIFLGARLWDTEEYSVEEIIDWDPAKGSLPSPKSQNDLREQERLYVRELERLQLSIDSAAMAGEGLRIGLTHYPPLDASLRPSRASSMLRASGVQHVVFGHLHSVRENMPKPIFGITGGVEYHLTSCDYLGFRPKLIAEA